MQTATAAKPISAPVRVDPALPQDMNDARPTETRYGWTPFKDISLVGPDGTMSLYVQPHAIASGAYDEKGLPVVVPNPYHRVLPKGQLIPFPSFPQIQYTLSEEQRDSKGSPVPVQSTRMAPALENIVSVSRDHSGQGFTVLQALQGLDEDTAHRIFAVVQPFQYPLGEIVGELEFGAIERINSREAIVFEIGDGELYHVDPLATDQERAIATQLAGQMAAGASVAFDYATEILNASVISINTRLSGGQGKVGPDTLDRYCAGQLGRENDFPTATGRNNGSQSDPAFGQKLDFLVGREQERSDKERIADLERQIAEMKAGQTAVAESADSTEATPAVATGVCGFVKTDGTACKRKTPKGERCGDHTES